jgi:hypothetical protein
MAMIQSRGGVMFLVRSASLALAVVLSAATGCGGDGGNGQQMGTLDQSGEAACVWDFEASVTTGSDSSFKLAGPLVLDTPSAAGSTTGTLFTLDGKVDVAAQFDDNGLQLNFMLSDGRTLVGTDPDHTALDPCPSAVQGSFTGPGEGDSGNWAVNTTYGANGTRYDSYTDASGTVTLIVVTDKDGNQKNIVRTQSGYTVS